MSDQYWVFGLKIVLYNFANCPNPNREEEVRDVATGILQHPYAGYTSERHLGEIRAAISSSMDLSQIYPRTAATDKSVREFLMDVLKRIECNQ